MTKAKADRRSNRLASALEERFRQIVKSLLLGKKLLAMVGIHQFAGLVKVVVDDCLWVNSHRMIDRGENFGRVDGVFHRCRACLIRLAVNVAAFDTGTPDDGSVAVGPMIASIGAVVVSTGGDSFFGTAPKFANGNDEGFIKQPAGVEVLKKGGESHVEHGS